MPNKIGDKSGPIQHASPVSSTGVGSASNNRQASNKKPTDPVEKQLKLHGPSYNEALKAAFTDATDGSGDDEANARQSAGRLGQRRDSNEGDITENSDVENKRTKEQKSTKKPNPNKTNDVNAKTEKSQSVSGISSAPLSSLQKHEKLVMSLGANASPGEIRTLASVQSFGNLKGILSTDGWQTSPRKSKSLNDLQMRA